MPLAVYNTSGEYAMIDAAGQLGRLDRDVIMFEALRCMKRAGADILISYAAKQAAKYLGAKRMSVGEEVPEHEALVGATIS